MTKGYIILILVSEKYQPRIYKRLEDNFRRSIIRFWQIPNYEARLYVLRRFTASATQARKRLFDYSIIPIGLTIHKLKKLEEEYTIEDFYKTLIFSKYQLNLKNYKINK